LRAKTDETEQNVDIISMEESSGGKGTYHSFAKFAWDALLATVDDEGTPILMDSESVPSDFLANSSPSAPGTAIDIFVRGLEPHDDSKKPPILRYARYALLETTSVVEDEDDRMNLGKVLPGIHVLNLVLFPNPLYDMPIFGADLVSLPGNKHLIAIDFQPVTTEGLCLPKEFETRLQEIHAKYTATFPWGGDIPPQAQRFFSPYALWTRIGSYPKPKVSTAENDDKTGESPVADTHEEAVKVIQGDIQSAFQEYLMLYLDLLAHVSKAGPATGEEMSSQLQEGHIDYLDYRKKNDPARPLLKRLYGEEWSEGLIDKVLFQNLE
jgi:hypothetical protein